MRQIRRILAMPLATIIRLMGAAIVANGGKRAPGADSSKQSDEDIARQLDAKARAAGANL